MRIIFMGSPDFAVPSLDAIASSGHELVAVYCQPPRPAGRGKADRKTAVHQRAEQLDIPVHCPKSLRDAGEQARFAAFDCDLAVVAAYGLILPRPILDAPRAGCINVHASLLPRWRGAAPVQRAILAGDETTGVTIMRMDEGLDTGPMLLRRDLIIGDRNTGQVIEKLAQMGADALMEWIEDPGPGQPQPDGATYAPKIAKSEARIDWTADAAAVTRQVRAFAPHPGAWFECRGERIKILQASEVAGQASPGTVVDDSLTIACGTGAIRPSLVQKAGRAAMTPGELLRGFAIDKGTVVE